MPKDWITVGKALEGLADRFRELSGTQLAEWRGTPETQIYDSMRVLEARSRMECDAIMRAVLHDPAGAGGLTPLQAFFCTMRVRCAQDTLGVLHAELNGRPLYPCPPDGWSFEELLEWLLVANWEHRHDAWLKRTVISVVLGVGL